MVVELDKANLLDAPLPRPKRPVTKKSRVSTNDVQHSQAPPVTQHASAAIVDRITANPLSSRSDMTQILRDLMNPLETCLSPGCARITLGHSGAGFDADAAGLEGYARALWGLGPLLATEPNHPLFLGTKARWTRGLINGTDPDHDEYWGDCGDRDQRLVEQAAISVSIAIAPAVLWKPLTDKQRSRVNRWLLQGNHFVYPASNWRYFRIINNVSMKLVGGHYDQNIIEQELDFVETFVRPNGLPSDGPQPESKAYDYYSTFAIQYYSLLLAKPLESQYPETAKRYRQRAIQTAQLFVHMLDPDGSAIPFGRSMTYRFACSAFWAAVAYDGLELPAPLSLGVIKGILLRNIRSFTNRREVFDRDGALTVGWNYPTLFMSENYNSPQSPYWALKSLLVLGLSASHPFWRAKEEPFPASLLKQPFLIARPWSQVMSHAAGHTFCLTSGLLPNRPQRGDAAKYAKFAYSSAFGFSVPTGSYGLEQLCPDSMLALSDDETRERWVVRRTCEDVRISDQGVIRSTWRPWPDVSITTWLKPPACADTPYHTRIHRITTPRRLSTCEGGFAISPNTSVGKRQQDVISTDKDDPACHGRFDGSRSSYVSSQAGMSGLIGIFGQREGKVLDVDSNSNLMAPRTLLPTLQGTIEPGTTWCGALVFGVPAEAAKSSQWVNCWRDASRDKVASVNNMLDVCESP